MNVLDLFSGIGGFSLGLERAGMTTVAFCEIDEFCKKILSKHWPNVLIYGDIKNLTAKQLEKDKILVDVICGGFPCQDLSIAGKGEGLRGERSGLWREYARLISEIRPQYVIVENVAALLFRGVSDVLGDLASLGYNAEWHCIPASYVGAPHRRDRIWIVAYPAQLQCDGSDNYTGVCVEREQISELRDGRRPENVAEPRRVATQISLERQFSAVQISQRHTWWEVEPDVGRVADGISARLDRLKSLGNAVVPQIPEIIGKAIIDHASRNAQRP